MRHRYAPVLVYVLYMYYFFPSKLIDDRRTLLSVNRSSCRALSYAVIPEIMPSLRSAQTLLAARTHPKRSVETALLRCRTNPMNVATKATCEGFALFVKTALSTRQTLVA